MCRLTVTLNSMSARPSAPIAVALLLHRHTLVSEPVDSRRKGGGGGGGSSPPPECQAPAFSDRFDKNTVGSAWDCAIFFKNALQDQSDWFVYCACSTQLPNHK